MKPVRPKTPKKPASKLKSAVKDPIEVYCRIRPLENELEQPCIKAKDEKTVVLFPSDVSQNTRTIKEIHYSFQRVFNYTTMQKELFDHVALPLVQDLLYGNNGLIFTYGITSSGKTYTMTGSPQDGGLLPRCLDVIFNSISGFQAKKYVFKPDNSNSFDIQSTAEALLDQQKQLSVFSKTPKYKNKNDIGEWSARVPDSTAVGDVNADVNYAVFVSYVEIYNNYIYDLLEDTTDDKKIKSLNSKILREDLMHNMYPSGVVEVEVKTADEALELFCKAQLRRQVSSNYLNPESSRSHSVFNIRVVQAPLDPQGAEVLQDKSQMIISQLSLVDLAGSERSGRTQNVGKKLKEAGSINSSLMVLRQCIEILRESQNQGIIKVVPYRGSKLTHLFKTFFEGMGKIRMVVCVNPRADNYDETVHVMRFAEMTQDVLISRPTSVSTPTMTYMRAGRGNLYREALRKAKEQGVSVTEVLAPAVYSLGPEFPQLVIHSSEDETVYLNLIEFLLGRITRRNTFVRDLDRRQDDFRRNLIAVDKENVQLKQEKSILQMDLNAREQQVRGLESKLSSSEETVETMKKQLSDLETEKENAMIELDSKARKLSEQSKEVERVRNKMQEKLALEKDRLRRIMERRLAEKQAELERKMCFTDEKFRQLREILNADDWEYVGDAAAPLQLASVPSTATPETSVPEGKVSRKATSNSAGEPPVDARLTKVKSAIDFFGGSSRQTAGQSPRNNPDSIFYKENRPPNATQRTPAVANPRHRRSHSSSGDVWIEHKPVGNLELNTVLQPAMKKKKSVSKLEVKDVTKSDVSKYVLQHQEQDSQGEVETQLYKADVIPSAGGGAQVIFNDVEKLKQVSPPPVYNLRKRSSDNLPLREIEDRCTVSVGCHGLPSKLLRKN